MKVFAPPSDWQDRGVGRCGAPSCSELNVMFKYGVPICELHWAEFCRLVKESRAGVDNGGRMYGLRVLEVSSFAAG